EMPVARAERGFMAVKSSCRERWTADGGHGGAVTRVRRGWVGRNRGAVGPVMLSVKSPWGCPGLRDGRGGGAARRRLPVPAPANTLRRPRTHRFPGSGRIFDFELKTRFFARLPG